MTDGQKTTGEDIENAYHRCCDLLHACDSVVLAIRFVPEESWQEEKARLVLWLIKQFAFLESRHEAAINAVRDHRVRFRAAFSPPCVIGGKPQHSYHEGICQYVAHDILDEVFNLTDDRQFPPPGELDHYHLGLHPNLPSAKGYWRSRSCDPNNASKGQKSFRSMLKSKLPVIREFFGNVDMDWAAAYLALDKEFAAVVTSLGHPVRLERWSQVRTRAEWAKILRVSKNTVTKRMREWEAIGEAHKEGALWQVADFRVPAVDDFDKG